MKRILGLDLGTNSIGWGLIELCVGTEIGKKFLGTGCVLDSGIRIIPMGQDVLGKFDSGTSISKTADRTKYRSARRLRERYHLRRERLHRVLNTLRFLPEHYASQIDFEKHFGQFMDNKEPKLAYDSNGHFIFEKSFEEMLNDFRSHQPLLLVNKDGKRALVPHDWTIYYLRKKALTHKIEKEELAWIILNFNQKRGYYQLRGEEEVSNKLVEFCSLKIVDVVADEKPNRKGDVWYSLRLENGWIYKRSSKVPLFDWKDKVRDFIVTTDLNDDGSVKIDKDGYEKHSFRAPNDDDWTLLKKKTETDIGNSQKTVGTYIYDALLRNPSQKIRGKLVRTIERRFYKDELIAILNKQVKLQPELFTEDLYNDCIRELYRSNNAHQHILSMRDFVHLFVNDIIFYQRPLRSQKSSIGDCSLEYRYYKKNKIDADGNPIKYEYEKDVDGKDAKVKKYLKAIPKSNPYYQEFRVWQWLRNLKIYKRDDDIDVTEQFIKNTNDWANLFDFLMDQKEVNHVAINKYLLEQYYFSNIEKEMKELYPKLNPEKLKEKIDSALEKKIKPELAKYRWNYVFDDSKEKEEDKSKKYPCNETRTQIKTRLAKVKNVPDNFFTFEIEHKLWHIIYSVTDKVEFEKALKTCAKKHGLDVSSFVESFKSFPPFKSEYGSFSERAIRNLLPLMRLGRYWQEKDIADSVKNKAESIKQRLQEINHDENELEKVSDDYISKQVLKSFLNVTDFTQGLKLHQASYLVYGRHSESGSVEKWNSVNDIERYLGEFKQHSLRNPIVEQIITETLRVVRDIWKQYGNGVQNFFDEIHIELGREMKNTTEERKRLTNIVTENEDTNLRIKALIVELKENSDGKLLVENVRPYSPIQQETLKIYEEFAVSNIEEDDPEKEFIQKVSKTAQPSGPELQRYKLWLEQKYRSPYTGQTIPLGKLFTTEYEIEHVIPQSRYFDDSLNNKVICEAAVNRLKDRQLGFEFIKNHHGEKVECGQGWVVEIFSEEGYKDFVKKHYMRNNTKRNNLLLEDIPDRMINRQLNDTRYISRYISQLLSNIVRADSDDDVNSKNLVVGNGKITSTLKQDWGLNDVWNELILPRFERMNELTETDNFTSKNQQGHTIPIIPFELSKGFQKKRIDHRHHAMDALIVACMTREHVQYLNNENAKSQKYHIQKALARKLRIFETVVIPERKKDETGVWRIKGGEQNSKKVEVQKEFLKPWDNFTTDIKTALKKIVASFKQNLRIINKTTNMYEKFKNGKKVKTKQNKGINWAIRKPLHKDFVFGKVDLQQVKIPKGKIAIAIRRSLDTTFDSKKIESITDAGIQKILRKYLAVKNNDPQLAFSPEGIEEMNNNICVYNDGKYHKPIYKVRTFEIGSRFSLGSDGNKKNKYVETADGTNLFFAVYVDKNGNRNYETIPLRVVINRLKQGLSAVPETNEAGHSLLFHLSPNDLVYVPLGNKSEFKEPEPDRIYKLTDSSDAKAKFVPANVANVIFNYNNNTQKKMNINYSIQNEFGIGSPESKSQNAITGEQIKKVCLKLKVDRLGKIELVK